jgi:GDP-4-dehydro-6-deoxy-D-mannose reductase
MKVLVTGSTGFVGRWLVRELASRGHEPVAAPARNDLDITDHQAVARHIRIAQPDAIAHLAAVSFGGDALAEPARALAVNEGGTRAVLAGAAEAGVKAVLVSGSSEVYGEPAPAHLPLAEDAPLHPNHPYGRSKLAQERAALELGERLGVPVVVTRSFNHIGPGQREQFVAPALATRLLEAKRSASRDVAVGDLDVERDFTDVRDVVRAYALLLEGLAEGRMPGGVVVNVASGRAVTIRALFEQLRAILNVAAEPRVDSSLLRPNQAPSIVGDASRLRSLTGWSPQIPLEQTLKDLAQSLSGA